MPDISLSQKTFERLQGHAKPFIDTPEKVILRALDALERPVQQVMSAPAVSSKNRTATSSKSEKLIDVHDLPDLTHTKLLYAEIDGKQIPNPKWKSLLFETLITALGRVGSFSELRRIFPVNMVEGSKSNHGYNYISDVDISMQAQDANGACRAVVMVAQTLDFKVDIEFVWRMNKDAAFPGERGRVQMNLTSPTNSTMEKTSG